MARVKPRYAIPFASNSCLLHDDVWDMNYLVQTPLAVRDHFEAFRAKRGLATDVRIMTPGDRWNSETGFHLEEGDWFENRDERLAEYRARVAPTMERQAALEARVTVPFKRVERFFTDLSAKLPGLMMRR